MPSDTFTYKYRPKNLIDFKMNSNLLQVLLTFIKLGKLNILLTGNSGTGKTSLMHAIICEYYGFDINLDHENILSINTLKDQGISYYRNEVRIFCQTSSAIKGKRKILIMDDIDFINEQSQQVFRNCIDKYTHNVCFIASCNNVQKVIDSLQSRMDIIRINPHVSVDLSNITLHIIKNEDIVLLDGVLDFIITICNGSVRILVNYLEKFKLLGQPIDILLAKQLCTNISFSDMEEYTRACIKGDISSAISIIDKIVQCGYSVIDILDNYFTFVKLTSVLDENQKYIIIPFICKYITIFHNLHEYELELVFFTNNIITSLQ
jgi:DNA polymerase III delta prime subunit